MGQANTAACCFPRSYTSGQANLVIACLAGSKRSYLMEHCSSSSSQKSASPQWLQARHHPRPCHKRLLQRAVIFTLLLLNRQPCAGSRLQLLQKMSEPRLERDSERQPVQHIHRLVMRVRAEQKVATAEAKALNNQAKPIQISLTPLPEQLAPDWHQDEHVKFYVQEVPDRYNQGADDGGKKTTDLAYGLHSIGDLISAEHEVYATIWHR